MRVLTTVLLAFSALMSVGCGSVNEAFVNGVDAYANDSGMLNEYDRYVEADPTLDADSKRIKKDTSAGLRRLVAEEKAREKKED